MLKIWLKKIMPEKWLNYYHQLLALTAPWLYGRPAEKLIIVGVTGTNGKTSTCIFIAKILAAAGFKVGVASSAIFKIGNREWLNDKKMTMLGRFALQKMLKKIVEADCRYAVIETSSQGIEQFRHLGIHYDIAVFTNLTPEHLEAHAGFDNYKQAKLKLFRHLEKLKHKKLSFFCHPDPALAGEGSQVSPRDPSPTAQDDIVKKVIVANGDDKYVSKFLDFKVDNKIVYGINSSDKEFSIFNFQFSNNFQFINIQNIIYKNDGISFSIHNTDFNLKLFGEFNVYNSLAAIAVAQSQGIDLAVCKKALEKITVMPGRMEFINEGQPYKVLVDYAPEPESMRQLFETIRRHNLVKGKIIHVFGSCGGGRDLARRPILGELSAKNAAIQIITNEDPYDDDPNIIIEQVAIGAAKAGKVLGENLFKILDRREAIKFALSQAQPGDLVLLTGKGCEQAICIAGGKKIKWDDREVAREELKKIL